VTVTDTLLERGERYGSFMSNACIAQQLKTEMRNGASFGLMSADQREALEVIAQKISRIVSGDADYIDNWHDIQGYAKLVEDRLKEDQARVDTAPDQRRNRVIT
jgi:hypothetical protein